MYLPIDPKPLGSSSSLSEGSNSNSKQSTRARLDNKIGRVNLTQADGWTICQNPIPKCDTSLGAFLVKLKLSKTESKEFNMGSRRMRVRLIASAVENCWEACEDMT